MLRWILQPVIIMGNRTTCIAYKYPQYRVPSIGGTYQCCRLFFSAFNLPGWNMQSKYDRIENETPGEEKDNVEG